MTVKKLIEELSKFDENRTVFVNVPEEIFHSPVLSLEETTVEWREEEGGEVLDSEEAIIISYEQY